MLGSHFCKAWAVSPWGSPRCASPSTQQPKLSLLCAHSRAQLYSSICRAQTAARRRAHSGDVHKGARATRTGSRDLCNGSQHCWSRTQLDACAAKAMHSWILAGCSLSTARALHSWILIHLDPHTAGGSGSRLPGSPGCLLWDPFDFLPVALPFPCMALSAPCRAPPQLVALFCLWQCAWSTQAVPSDPVGSAIRPRTQSPAAFTGCHLALHHQTGPACSSLPPLTCALKLAAHTRSCKKIPNIIQRKLLFFPHILILQPKKQANSPGQGGHCWVCPGPRQHCSQLQSSSISAHTVPLERPQPALLPWLL